ncbi:MAG: RNA polymerase sigma factor [Acidimicrobiia bacterium]
MSSDGAAADEFADFVRVAEERLSFAYAASYGSELGVEATAEALAYAWEHWDRVRQMSNPLGYLYRVGQSKVRRHRWRRPPIAPPLPPTSTEPRVEPRLLSGLASLTRNQRVAVVLIEGFQWTQREVADLLDISRSSVQKHYERGLKNLRESLEVTSDV